MISSADILKASILIVDDQEPNVAVLEQMLHGAGYVAVTSTKNPREVCELYRQNRYDLILLDLQMPGMDGFQVMAGLKEIETEGYIPVLVITAQPDHKLRALNAGAKDFVSKPFDLAEVLIRVRNLLEVRLLHRSETALNHARLENSQRIASLGDWEYDFAQHRLLWSEEVYRILGISRKDCPPEAAAFYRQVHPDDLAFVHRQKKIAAEGSRRVDFEHRIIRPGGEVRHLHQITGMIFDDQGRPVREVGTIQDITERKVTDEIVKRLAAIVENSADAIVSETLDGIVTSWNPAAAKMFGYAAAEIVGQPLQVLIPLDRPNEESEILAGFRRGEQVRHIETVRVRKDGLGVDVFVTVSAIKDPDGKIVGASKIVRDITELKRAEKSLRASEKRFKALFEQAAVGVAQGDAVTGRFVQINQRFCDIAGRSRQEMEQLTFVAITHPDDLEYDLETARQFSAGVIREFTREKRYLRKDGSEVWVNLTVSAMWAPGETPDYFIAVAQDITGRKKLEEQFQQAQKMEAIGTLAGGIAHDFNNILAVIRGYTDLAQMILTDNAEVREYLGAVLEASSRATELVRQILTFSRQQRPARRVIQLRPVVAETFKLLRATIPSTIEFDLALATDAPTVLADATQIHQVLMNLGTNAWHAMKDRSGRLEVKLERCAVDATHATAQPQLRPGIYARISVSDTGCGMNQATQRRIFEPFFTTKPPGEGTGLGLSVVHGIMESHDGVVTVYSQPGEGTVFHLYFPAHAGVPIVAADEEKPAPHGQGERLLFVDDEEVLAELGQKTLTALGYVVEVAMEPATALEMVRADPQRFALVLTNQTMPGMTGLALANRLRQISPGIRVILMTGYGLSLTPNRLKAAGVREILLKPVTLHSLGSAVHAALSANSTQHPWLESSSSTTTTPFEKSSA